MTILSNPPYATIEDASERRNRVLAFGIRQVLIMALGLVEDWLCVPKSITPKHRRDV